MSNYRQRGKKLTRSGVYKITNIIDGIFYIGGAENCSSRKGTHWSSLKQNKHINSNLQDAVNLHGLENFKFEVLEYFDLPEGLDKAGRKNYIADREQIYLDSLLFAQEYIRGEDNRFLELGYNRNPIASSSKYVKLTTEHKKKISETSKTLDWDEINRKRIINLVKPILAYDLQGKFVKEYSSISDAGRELGGEGKGTCVTRVLKGIKPTYKGYTFKYKESEDFPKKIDPPRNNRICPVEVYDLEWNLIGVFNSQVEVQKALSLSKREVKLMKLRMKKVGYDLSRLSKEIKYIIKDK